MEKTFFLFFLSIFCGLVLGNVWTTDCSNLATQRLDPIVYPGELTSVTMSRITGIMTHIKVTAQLAMFTRLLVEADLIETVHMRICNSASAPGIKGCIKY